MYHSRCRKKNPNLSAGCVLVFDIGLAKARPQTTKGYYVSKALKSVVSNSVKIRSRKVPKCGP